MFLGRKLSGHRNFANLVELAILALSTNVSLSGLMGSNDARKFLSFSLFMLSGLGTFTNSGASWPVKCLHYFSRCRVSLTEKSRGSISNKLWVHIFTGFENGISLHPEISKHFPKHYFRSWLPMWTQTVKKAFFLNAHKWGGLCAGFKKLPQLLRFHAGHSL